MMFWSQYSEAEAGRCLWVQSKTGLHKDFQASQGYLLGSNPILKNKTNKTTTTNHRKVICSHVSL